MAPSTDLIDFGIIESHKENIQSLPSGRSAKALATLYSPPTSTTHPSLLSPSPQDTTSINALARQSYESELTRIEEADDPLDVYDRYVKWTLDAYPSASATKESGLLQLLERATKAFLKDEDYKNDPRYLKLWLLYIKLFCQGSESATTGGKAAAARDGESARDTYIFLSRNGVGQSLALFYESFAEWLELGGRWQQAAEIWDLGIERGAKPVARLVRKSQEFEQRRAAKAESEQGPSSPALPTARPALGVKRDPFSTSAGGEGDPQAADRERDRAATAAAASGAGRSRRQKLEIFADSDENGAPKAGAAAGAGGWENIGSLADRRKENATDARPWAGEKLDGGGRRLAPAAKMAIFKDRSQSKLSSFHEKQITVNPVSGKGECVFVKFEAVYPQSSPAGMGDEFCFEELRARHRGWFDRDWAKEKEAADEAQVRSQKKTKAEKQRKQDEKRNKELQIFIDEDTMSAKLLAEQHQADVPRQQDGVSQQLNNENEGPRSQDTTNPARDDGTAAAKAAKKARKEEKANRTRKIRVMEVKAETQTVQTNLASPTGPKLKRKKSGEATMTVCTKEAMDEIYDIFNQTLSNVDQPEPEAESDESDDEDDYTSAGESTGTGMISGDLSEAGDYTQGEADFTEAIDKDTTSGEPIGETGWSTFSEVKSLPKEADDDEDIANLSGTTWSDPTALPKDRPEQEEVITPTSPEAQHVSLPTRYVPVPPDDYNAPVHPYRNSYQVANNRLPFMTPIVEKTESSIGASTALAAAAKEKDYFNSKTPCRQKSGATITIQEDDGPELWSSPFDADIRENKENVAEIKLPQPALPKPAKPSKDPLGAPKPEIERQASSQKPKEAIQKGPIIKDAQCNPVNEHIRTQILENVQPPLSTYDGYFDRRSLACGKGADIRKYTKAVSKSAKQSNDKTATTIAVSPALAFDGTDRRYTIKRELGQGAFAPVYLVESSNDADEDTGDEQAPAQMGKGAFGVARSGLEAVKMENPPTSWEFYILRQAKRRLGVSRPADSIVQAFEMHLFQDECFLIEEYRDQGTLLNAVNLARAEANGNGGMEEPVAMFYTVELLRTVEALHGKGLIHGDLKADNVLLRLDQSSSFSSSVSDAGWASQYRKDGTQGWAERGITLIDFGRGIDMKVFVPEVQFIADWKTSAADCAEMREMRPWTYQIDYHGLAGIIHTLLFGKYIETVAERGGGLGAGATKTYRLREGLKRYWQTEIWTECFDMLLNPLSKMDVEDGRKMPLVKGLRAVREKMESYLESNCERGAGLKGSLRRLEAAVKERKQ